MELRKADGAVIAVAVASYFVVRERASPSDRADRHTRARARSLAPATR
jgi:hypothetical protein